MVRDHKPLLYPSLSSLSIRYNNPRGSPLMHFYERTACFKPYMSGNVRDILIKQSVTCTINKILLLCQHSGDSSDIYTVTTQQNVRWFWYFMYVTIADWSIDSLFFLPYYSLSSQQFSSFQGASWFSRNLDMRQRKAWTSDKHVVGKFGKSKELIFPIAYISLREQMPFRLLGPN